MITMKDDMTIYFRGDNAQPAAFVMVGIYGREDARAFDALTAAICEILKSEANISPDHVYVQYAATAHWGWNGGNF